MLRRLMPLLASLMLLLASQANALSLGDLNIGSGAGQPLDARITLLDFDGVGLGYISVAVASTADYERFGLERSPVLDNLRFNIEFTGPSRTPSLHMSSLVRINEPFLSLLLDTRWTTGRVLTEYTVRLEAPVFSAQTANHGSVTPTRSVFETPTASPAVTQPVAGRAVAAQPSTPVRQPLAQTSPAPTNTDGSRANAGSSVVSSATPASTPAIEPLNNQSASVQPENTSQQDATLTPAADAAPDASTESADTVFADTVPPATTQATAAASQTALSDSANASTITVNAGDTLWEIAQRIRPDSSVSVQQTMLALQRLNPDAFINSNINQVRRGEILRVPEFNEIGRLSQSEAVAEVTRQNQALAQRRGASASSQPLTAAPATAGASGEQGELRLVTVDEPTDQPVDASAAGDQQAQTSQQLQELENRLSLRREDLDRMEAQNEELTTRLAMLQQQISSAQEIIRLRDLELAQLQQSIAEQEAAVPAPAPPPTVVTMAPDASPFERLMNAIINNTWALVGGALALVLLLVMVLVGRNKSNIDPDESDQVENQILSETSDSDELLFSGVAAAAAAADDERQLLGEHSTDVEFNSETELEELYAADDDSTEQVSVSWHQPEPGMLEDEFGIAAEAVTDPIDLHEPTVEESTESSQTADYSDDFEIAEPGDDADAFDTSWPTADTPTGPAIPDNEDAGGNNEPDPDAEEIFSDIMDDEFSWTSNDDVSARSTPETHGAAPSLVTPAPAEFDISEPDDEVEFEDLAFLSPEDSFDDDADDMLDEGDHAFLSGSDATATKLDLARAYVDMGDADGAREILSEVLQEGTEVQRNDAQSLLDRIQGVNR